jgi:integrase/recombinase XerD
MDLSKYLRLQAQEQAVLWLTFECNRGLAENTLHAYARGLEDFFGFCIQQEIKLLHVGLDDIGLYIQDLRQRQLPVHIQRASNKGNSGLTKSTINQRLTAVRRFYDYLEEEGIVKRNPVRRGRYVHHNAHGGERGLVPKIQNFPWIPDEEQWERIIAVLQKHKLRDKLLFALSYDGALRREEVCGLHISDFDVAYRLLRIRAENTKSRRARSVSYSESTGQLLRLHLRDRAQMSRQHGALCLSESPRNYGQPLTSAIWSKTVRSIAQEADVPFFTPHTLRHLRLTDLARAGVDLHDIATFAGHRNIDTTMQYIHLSGTELADRIGKRLEQLNWERLPDLSQNGEGHAD